ncbi:MAG: protein-tyrosine phosphatase family protein [Cytophagales bacterium]|nr:protein-tyrosine phosphatase family protein [Cytophagales bacterium]
MSTLPIGLKISLLSIPLLLGCVRQEKENLYSLVQLRGLWPAEENAFRASRGVFRPKRVRYVDRFQENILFRGAYPGVEGKIVYLRLDSAMKSQTPTKKYPYPKEKEVIFISLMNHLQEAADLHAEVQFFARKQHAPPGYVLNLPVMEAITKPEKFPKAIRYAIAKKLPTFSLIPIWTEQIRSLLIQKTQNPRIIYIHCFRGIDRTGTMVAAYQMRYMGKSYEEARKESTEMAKLGPREDIFFYSIWAIQWYALYLREGLNMRHIGNIDEL